MPPSYPRYLAGHSLVGLFVNSIFLPDGVPHGDEEHALRRIMHDCPVHTKFLRG